MYYDEDGNRHATVTEDSILGFFDEYRFLSNFHVCNVEVDGIEYKSSEAAYMAGKTDDPALKLRFSELTSPSEARKLGITIPLRGDWEHVRLMHMGKVLAAKFTQNPDLRSKLLSTGNKYLEETNDWCDNYWGNDIHSEVDGYNMLGKSLMIIRGVIRG